MGALRFLDNDLGNTITFRISNKTFEKYINNLIVNTWKTRMDVTSKKTYDFLPDVASGDSKSKR